MILNIAEVHKIESEMLKVTIDLCNKHNIKYFMAYGSALGAVRHQGPIPWDHDVDLVIPNDQMDLFLKVFREELPEKYYMDFYDTNKYYTPSFPRIGLKGYVTSVVHIDIFILTGISENKEEQKKLKTKMNIFRKMNRYKIASDVYFQDLKGKKRIKFLFYKILFMPININWIRKKLNSYYRTMPYKDSKFVTNPGGGYDLKEIIPKDYYGDGLLVKYDGIDVRIPEKHDLYLKHFYGDYMTFPPEKDRKIKESLIIQELTI